MPVHGIVEQAAVQPLDEPFRLEGHKTWFETVEELQTAFHAGLVGHQTERLHQGGGMNGRIPANASRDGVLETSENEDKIDL